MNKTILMVNNCTAFVVCAILSVATQNKEFLMAGFTCFIIITTIAFSIKKD